MIDLTVTVDLNNQSLEEVADQLRCLGVLPRDES